MKLAFRLLLILICVGSGALIGFEYYQTIALPTFAFQRDSQQNGAIYYFAPNNINLIWDKTSQQLELIEAGKLDNTIKFGLAAQAITEQEFEAKGFEAVSLENNRINLLPKPECKYIALVLTVRSEITLPSQAFRNLSCEIAKEIKYI